MDLTRFQMGILPDNTLWRKDICKNDPSTGADIDCLHLCEITPKSVHCRKSLRDFTVDDPMAAKENLEFSAPERVTLETSRVWFVRGIAEEAMQTETLAVLTYCNCALSFSTDWRKLSCGLRNCSNTSCQLCAPEIYKAWQRTVFLTNIHNFSSFVISVLIAQVRWSLSFLCIWNYNRSLTCKLLFSVCLCAFLYPNTPRCLSVGNKYVKIVSYCLAIS